GGRSNSLSMPGTIPATGAAFARGRGGAEQALAPWVPHSALTDAPSNEAACSGEGRDPAVLVTVVVVSCPVRATATWRVRGAPCHVRRVTTPAWSPTEGRAWTPRSCVRGA